MSLRLPVINAYLRWVIKRGLAKVPTPQQARANMERTTARLPVSRRGLHVTTERVDGPGGPIPVEWVAPEGATRRRVIVYLHGGAHVMGSPRTHRAITFSLARMSGMRVAVPDYRLAPEHPAPAARDDAVALYADLLRNGHEGGGIALAGESSGGGLCFSALLALAERGFPRPACVAAFSPWCDLTKRAASVSENARREAMLPVERWDETVGYVTGGAREADDPVVSPLFGRFRDPPPVLIQASRDEILRDDALAMAERLREAGGAVTLEMHPKVPHAWPYFAPYLPEAREALARAAAFLDAHVT